MELETGVATTVAAVTTTVVGYTVPGQQLW
jgi:hypothetical protein